MAASELAEAHAAETPAPRDTWLGLALHIERRLDAGLDIEHRGSLSIAERLDRLGKTDSLENARAILGTAPITTRSQPPSIRLPARTVARCPRTRHRSPSDRRTATKS